MTVEAFIGTSGYSYPAWKGSFYPGDLPNDRMLSFYAGKLRTVEINNTFYRMPSAKIIDAWASQVPSSFSFAVKAPRRITHELRLKRAADALTSLFSVTAELGSKLGPILFQLPPNMKKDAGVLGDFLKELPERRRVAFEFRHSSWFDDEIFGLLRSHQAALCLAESDDLATPIIPTAPWGYLRLRREAYADEDIQRWAKTILSQDWKEAFIYFKHEEAGKGPKFASQLESALNP